MDPAGRRVGVQGPAQLRGVAHPLPGLGQPPAHLGEAFLRAGPQLVDACEVGVVEGRVLAQDRKPRESVAVPDQEQQTGHGQDQQRPGQRGGPGFEEHGEGQGGRGRRVGGCEGHGNHGVRNSSWARTLPRDPYSTLHQRSLRGPAVPGVSPSTRGISPWRWRRCFGDRFRHHAHRSRVAFLDRPHLPEPAAGPCRGLVGHTRASGSPGRTPRRRSTRPEMTREPTTSISSGFPWSRARATSASVSASRGMRGKRGTLTNTAPRRTPEPAPGPALFEAQRGG